jgi:hypothetical protein
MYFFRLKPKSRASSDTRNDWIHAAQPMLLFPVSGLAAARDIRN